MSMTSSVKTVVSDPSTIGTSTNRRYLRVMNDSTDTRIRLGGSDITASKGVILEPGEYTEFRMLSASGTEIYAVSEGRSIKCSIFESFED